MLNLCRLPEDARRVLQSPVDAGFVFLECQALQIIFWRIRKN